METNLQEFDKQFDYEKLNDVHKEIISTVFNKWQNYLNGLHEDQHVIVDYDNLFDMLDEPEQKLVTRLFEIDPKELGFNGPFYSKDKPGKLVKIENQKFVNGDHVRYSGVQYCPEHSFADFSKMAEACEKETGKKIFIDSGYRSPGRQAFLIIRSLANTTNFRLLETGRWIAFPGYSEHGSPVNNAVDISTAEGINGFSDGQEPEDFENTKEYEWLNKNANKYNFYLSYPRDNEHGVGYEPWHWHWEKTNN